MRKNSRGLNRTRKSKFQPTSAFLQKAVSEYLDAGGTIKKLKFGKQSYEDFFANTSGQNEADEFLNGSV